LPVAVTEAVILAVARELDCAYGWHAHVPLALAAGVSRSALARAGSREPPVFEDREMHRSWSIAASLAKGGADPLLHDLAATEPTRAVELTLLAGVYRLIFQLVDLDGLERMSSDIAFLEK
jgi:AhpD family alkylhydroperoxidase